jgi:hypothetical protein
MDEAINAAQSADQCARDMHALRNAGNRRSEVISKAGLGLCAIGDLLGADASEHLIDYDQQYGLANAVVAIGELLKSTGNRLFSISDQSQQRDADEAQE